MCLVVLVTGTLSFALAEAEPILPKGKYPKADAAIARQDRQFDVFNASPFGLSLNVHVKDTKARQEIDAFMAQDQVEDFNAFAGGHLHERMSMFGEHGDLGFFGGVALAGTAFKYLALKKEGAPESLLQPLRAKIVRAAESWHVFYVVTGGNGVVARGIVRLVPEDPSAPPFPEASSWVATPLHDENGQPLPRPKNNGTYREDNSNGVLPKGVWGWIDSASKDQLIGQVLGLVSLYEAMKDDPLFDQALVARLAQDALLVARMLMTPHEIAGLEGLTGEGQYDLIIWDADGRPTFHHDINPLSLEKVYAKPEDGVFNVFNLFMAIGILKGLWHVTGDPELERFIYEECLGRRRWLDLASNFNGPGAFNYIYMGAQTNTDNVDMTAVALFLALYTEKDPAVAKVLRRFLEEGWWDPAYEKRFSASRSKQPLWHALYLAVTDRGTGQGLRDELGNLLGAFPLGPYWQDPRVNCDETEIAKGECVAIDGKTIIKLYTSGEKPKATEALDPSIRPCSDFNARSDSFEVNGGGDGLRLNPGGDLRAAYWIARYMEARGPGEYNLSPHVRDHMPAGQETVAESTSDVLEPDEVLEPRPEAAEAADVLWVREAADSGCVAGQGSLWAMALVLAVAFSRPRRR